MVLNKDITIKNIILLGFAYFMIKIYFTGQIAKYVHPRMNIYILLCGIYFIILAIFNFKTMFIKNNHRINKAILTIFTIPLCIALFVPPASLSADVLKNKGTNISQKGNNNTQVNNSFDTNTISSTNTDSSSNNIGSIISYPQNFQGTDSKPLMADKGIIKVSDKDYYLIVSELFDHLDAYQGKQIEINGYVFRDKSFRPNQFVIGKTLITCCTADASIFGLMANMKGAYWLNNNDWYTVTGTIKTVIDQGEKIPGIEVSSVKKISKPKDEYVYP